MSDFNDMQDSKAVKDAINAAKPIKSGSQVKFRCLFDVKAEPIKWLWQGRIARGKLTILAGDPGLGKSQLTRHLWRQP